MGKLAVYSVQVWDYDGLHAVVLDYKTNSLSRVECVYKVSGGYQASYRGRKSVGRDLRECLGNLFGFVNVSEGGKVIPCNPTDCAGGRELFRLSYIIDTHALYIENLAWASRGIEWCVIKYGFMLRRSRRFSYGYFVRPDGSIDLFIFNIDAFDYYEFIWETSGLVTYVSGTGKNTTISPVSMRDLILG